MQSPAAVSQSDQEAKSIAEVDRMFKTAEAIAEQVWREQQLSSMRMTWNLSFQGLAMAAFVLTMRPDIQIAQKLVVQLLIAMSGAVVAIATLVNVRASQEQRDRLRQSWERLNASNDPLAFPCPFSEKRGSSRARTATQGILWTATALWIAFGCVVALPTLSNVWDKWFAKPQTIARPVK